MKTGYNTGYDIHAPNVARRIAKPLEFHKTAL